MSNSYLLLFLVVGVENDSGSSFCVEDEVYWRPCSAVVSVDVSMRHVGRVVVSGGLVARLRQPSMSVNHSL